MSQAETANTTTRAPGNRLLGFSPRSLSPGELAHTELLANIAIELPYRIRGVADAIDLRDTADHIRTVFEMVLAYADAIVEHTAYVAPCGTISASRRQDATAALEDAMSDYLGMLTNAAEDLRVAA